MRFASGMTAVLVLALSPLSWWQSLWRDTNSNAAAQQGKRQYAARQYDPAARSFAAADKLAPGPRSAFNLGTAQIAAGDTTEGSATLSRAMKDPSLRADSFYNRGNSALASKAYEYAIRDYVESLKLRPGDANTKRNLEIALERLDAVRKQAGGRQGQQQPSPSQAQNQKAPTAGQKEQQQQQQESEAEALLRSVQQQEQEELQRMKRTRTNEVRIGW